MFRLQTNCQTLFFLTKTWLNANVPDSTVNLQYLCKNSVAAYVSNCYYLHKLRDFEDQDFKVLWFLARPQKLPRPLSILLCAVTGCQPSYNADTVQTCDTLLCKHVNAAIFMTGDFSDFSCDCPTKPWKILRTVCSQETLRPVVMPELASALNRVCWQQMYAMDDVNQQLEFYYYSISHCTDSEVPYYFVKVCEHR